MPVFEQARMDTSIMLTPDSALAFIHFASPPKDGPAAKASSETPLDYKTTLFLIQPTLTTKP